MSQITQPKTSMFKRAALFFKRTKSSVHHFGKIHMEKAMPFGVKVGDKLAPPAAGVLFVICSFAVPATILLTALGYATVLGLCAGAGYAKGACRGARFETLRAKRLGFFGPKPR